MKWGESLNLYEMVNYEDNHSKIQHLVDEPGRGDRMWCEIMIQ